MAKGFGPLGKYLDVDKEIKEQDEKIETTKEAIKYIEELFQNFYNYVFVEKIPAIICRQVAHFWLQKTPTNLSYQ